MESLLSTVNDWKDLIPLIGMLFVAHRQAMKKLDDVIESNHEIKETVAIHNEKLDNGESRMDRLEDEIGGVRKRVHDMAQTMHKIPSKYTTPSQVETIIKANVK